MNDKRAQPFWRIYRGRGDLLLLLLPGMLLLLIFCYLPMIGLITAFKDFRLNLGILHSPWNGLDNFSRLFGSPDFPLVIRNTLVISVLRLTVGFAAPIILALLINEVRCKWYSRTIQTVTYLPYFFSWVVLSGIFLMIFSQRGPINQLLGLTGASAINFFSDDTWFIITVILTGIWQTVGYGAIIYLAALSGIDPVLYEAAVVDGANRWHRTVHITLPSLLPTIITLFILQLGYILSAGFDQIYNLYNPTVYDVADIVDTYVLRRLVSMDFGLATAAGLFKSVIGLILVVMANSLARSLSDGEQGVW